MSMTEERPNHIIPPKLCAWCGIPFTPTRPQQRYCPRPSACAHKGAARLLKGIVPEKAVAAKKARDAALIQRQEADKFGTLSDRELAIYRHAYQRGYDRGYQLAYGSKPAGTGQAA